MYRNLLVLTAGCLVCVAVFVLTFTRSRREPADFVWNNATEPQTLDPTLMSGQPEGEIALGLFEGLTSYHPRTLEPVPGVASSWEIDGLTYTFHLRPDAWWVRGDRIFEAGGRKRNVTAHDIIFSWRRHLAPETGSEYSYLLYPIEGAEEYERTIHADWKERKGRFLAAFEGETGRPFPAVSFATAAPPAHLDAREKEAYVRFIEEVRRFRDAEFARLVRLEAPDERTLVVTLRSPAPYFLFLTSFYPLFPVPREAVERHGDDWTRPENIVTNGPYILEEWRFNAYIRLRKNRHYWENGAHAARRLAELSARQRDAALLPRERRELELLERFGTFVDRGLEIIDAVAVEEENTSLNLYLNGDVDRIRDVPSSVLGDLIEYSREHDLPHLHHGTEHSIYYYVINTRLPVFQGGTGRKLRRALSLAVDRQALIDVVTRGFQRPAYRMVPPGTPGYDDGPLFGSGDHRRDLEAAKALVAEVRAAGVKIPRLKVLYNTKESHARIAAFIQNTWRYELGVEVELGNQEWGVYLDSKRTGQYDIARSGWIGDYPDPRTFLDLFTTGNQNNDPRYSNPLYDRIVLEYCPRTLDILAAAASRRALLEDIASWPRYREAVEPVRLAGGGTLGAALRETVSRGGAASGAARLEAASRLRSLLFQAAEAMLIDDMPVIPLYFYTRTLLWPPELEGIFFNVRDSHPLKTLRWAGSGTRSGAPRYGAFPRFSTAPRVAEAARSTGM